MLLISQKKGDHSALLPEKIRKALEKTVADLRVRENVYGVGLFGSWSRGDATIASDIDLLILDTVNFDSEYVERMEVDRLFIDLDHVPRNWILSVIPPEIDQKLYETQILYDRDWSLHNTKLLMTKSYGSPERVDIRTEAHVVDSDIYLSRATSAFSREDHRSACLFAKVALESVLKVLVEIALEPFSSSRFLEKLEVSASRLGMHDVYRKYLSVTDLDEVDRPDAESKLKLFQTVWDDLRFTVNQNSQTLESCHFRVRTKLNYYLNQAFLRGLVARTEFLIDSGRVSEAFRYLDSVFLDLVESYVWFKSVVDKVKFDYSTFLRSLEFLEAKNPRNFDHIVSFLCLNGVDKAGSADVIERTREVMFKVRGERKVLIKNHLLNC